MSLIAQSSWFHSRWLWLLLLIIPYTVSILWLNLAAAFVPLVVLMAPMGLAKLIGNPIHYEPLLWLSHLIFWTLYLTAFIGARRLATPTLRKIFLGLAAIVVCTCYGCATYHANPLKDWKGAGTLATVSPPEAIQQDALAYFRSLPDKRGSIVDSGALSAPDAVTYYEDGTGQHAVVLDAPSEGEYWHYAVIYDRNNRRIKTLRYSLGWYMMC